MKFTQQDKYWSMAVKILARNRCEFSGCGRTAENSHHVFGRRYRSTMYDVNNGVALCYNHHINLAHQRPLEFAEYIIRKRGLAWYELLKIKSRRIKQDVSLDILYCKKVCEGKI